ncbi:MAG: CotH kinase family protein [Defluviitaleaceae bacterium]|nr:CotH kinase family protein [Defluviitaleaceae bacterium]
MKKILMFAVPSIILVALAVLALIQFRSGNESHMRGEVVLDESIAPPVFSHESGFYQDEFFLTLSGAGANQTIRFTLDGSEPTANSPAFTRPIRIYSPTPTRYNNPMTLGVRPGPAPRMYYNGMVVRARIFDGYSAASHVTTQSFFVERDVDGRSRGDFNMRVVSISIQPEYFAGSAGMYQNFNMDIRHISYVEVFYPDGSPLLSQNAELRVAGNWSRREMKKSLRLNFNRGGGVVDNIDLIPDTRQGFHAPLEPVSMFRHVTLRTADLHVTTIREALADRISEPLRLDNQNAIPAAVFINGEFWGIYCLREHRSSRTFIAARYPGISENSVTILDFAWNTRNSGDHSNCNSRACQHFANTPEQIYPLNPCLEGTHEPDGPFGPWLDALGRLPRQHPIFRAGLSEGQDHGLANRSWMRMYNAVTGGRVYCDSCMNATIMPRNCDQCRYGLQMSYQADFDAAMEFACFDNLIDNFIVYYHFDNWDWPGNNKVAWQTNTVYPGITGGDGKWRFIVHDFDNAFWQPRRNMMNVFTTPGTNHGAGTGGVPSTRVPYYHDNQPIWAVTFWRNLMENKSFRNTLAARYATYNGTVFAPARVNHLVNQLVAEREADIGSDFYRWNMHGGSVTGSVDNWRRAVNHLRYFGRERGGYGLEHMRLYFNRTDRPNLGLDLPSALLNIRWRTDTTMGFFDIAGAQIRPDLFERDGAFTFDINNFHGNYIWGLPIEVTARPLEGYRFSHFEVTGVIEMTATQNPMVIDVSGIAPPSGISGMVVVAVFEAD